MGELHSVKVIFLGRIFNSQRDSQLDITVSLNVILVIIFVNITSLANNNSTNLYGYIFQGQAVKITSVKISEGRLISYENILEKQLCFSSRNFLLGGLLPHTRKREQGFRIRKISGAIESVADHGGPPFCYHHFKKKFNFVKHLQLKKIIAF